MNNAEKHLVLIADDERTVCNVFSEYLSALGYKTVVAFDGAEALALFNEYSPHVVIADIHMPVMDGLQLLEEIRKHNAFTPVIITTGHPNIDTAIKAIQNGAYDYIVKPCRLEMLHQKIGQALTTAKLVIENAVLTKLASLHEITNRLTTTHDLKELLDVAFNFCLEVSNSDSGSIQLVDQAKTELVIVRRKGIKSTKLRSSLKDLHEWPISKWVCLNGRSLLIADGKIVSDVSIDVPPLRRDDVGSSLSVPLKASEEVIGVVNLNRSKNQDPFSIVDQNIIDVLAAQAGIAINNANLYTSISQKLSEISLISSYSDQLMGVMEKDKVLKSLFETVQKNFAIDVIGFLIAQKRSHEFVYWSRGKLDDVSVQSIGRKVIESYNELAKANVQQKRVTMRIMTGLPHTAVKIKTPLLFEHIVAIVEEDFSYGAVYFGAVHLLEHHNEKLALLSSLINQTRIALTNSKLYTDMKENYIRTIKALAIAVDAKDTYTHGHSENVMTFVEEIAREMNLDERMIGVIRDAGLLHDIGKIGIPGSILNKTGPLTYEEFNGVMKTHSTLGANIVKEVPFLEELYKLILYHHEHYNGVGYPEGLKGEAIPLGARIIHVADAYEAMTSNRPYRNSLGPKEAIKRLLDGSGIQFDPDVVNSFVRVAERKGWIES